MSDLYNLSDEELLQTDLTVQELEPDEEQEDTTQEPTEPVESTEEVDGTDIPNEPQEATDEPVEADTEVSDEVQEESTVDYQAFYETMTKPFKANGREISIDNADDAIRLMQMGANYSKKMEQLKPKQALLKVLEENQLDSKEKLGFLIDLANKKPEAIAKLVKESEIDLYDFDLEQANSYEPHINIPEPSLFEETLQEVIEHNPIMSEVVNHMVGWDSHSKDVIFNEPNMLRTFSEHKANGLYDKIINKIEHERMLGRMVNIPYLQAYATVEQELMQTQANTFTAPRPTNSKPDDNLDKKKKAGLPNGNVANEPQTFNALAVSDEELLQLMAHI